MIVSLEEMKNYLRVDYAEDDALIQRLISAAERLCMDVARVAGGGRQRESRSHVHHRLSV